MKTSWTLPANTPHSANRQADQAPQPTGRPQAPENPQQDFMTTMKAEDIAYISCRTRKPWTSKINPAWWFMNDDEQRVEDAPWYRPEWPAWFRAVVWNLLRNPLQNFRAYVVGVSDRNYVVRGRAPVMTVQRNDLVPPEYGYQWCVIELRWLRLPFVSYSGRHVVWYAGWQPSGFFGCKFNLHRSAVSNWERERWR